MFSRIVYITEGAGNGQGGTGRGETWTTRNEAVEDESRGLRHIQL